MNQKPFLVILPIFLFYILSVGCSRYEDNNYPSIFPAKDRLVNTWEFISYQEAGENITPLYLDSLIIFKDDNEAQICDRTQNACREGRWDFIRDKEELQLIFGLSATTFEIRRLRRDEMWLESIDSANLRWELKPLED